MFQHASSVFLFWFVCFGFLRQFLTLLPRLEYSGVISAHCNLCLPDSSAYPAFISQAAKTIGTHHHAWPNFVFLEDTGFHHVGQAGLKLLISSDLPAPTSQIGGLTGISHHAWPSCVSLYFLPPSRITSCYSYFSAIFFKKNSSINQDFYFST